MADVILTINPTPADSTVTLVATGYLQSGNSMTVPEGTTVAYTVAKTGYYTKTGSIEVEETTTEDITLLKEVTLTVTPVPSDATVTLTASGSTQSGNSITVPEGAQVVYTVEKATYNTVNGTLTITEDVTFPVDLSSMFKFTVIPTPGDSTVVLEATGYLQDGKSITVPNGTTVTYTVSHDNYATTTGTYAVTSTTSVAVGLTKPISIDVNVIAENLAELLTNSVNMTTKFYDIFINPDPMDVELQMYNEENQLITVIIPNRAKDRSIALSGSGSPEGVVTANIGASYVDIVQRQVYFKTQGTGNTGWSSVLTESAIQSYLANYLTANHYVTETSLGTYLVNNNYIDRTALNTTLSTFVPTCYMNQLNTSGTLQLSDNSAYTVTPSGSIVFSLPTITDLTKLHKILVQINMTTVYSIDVGTIYFFDRIAPDLSMVSMYNLLYEYDNLNGRWVVGWINKGAAS